MATGAAVGIAKVILGAASLFGLGYAVMGTASADEKKKSGGATKDKDLELDPFDPTQGGGGKELLSCDQAIEKLPPEMAYVAKTMLAAPRTEENIAATNKVAMSFDAAAAQPGFAPIKDALLVAAACLRSYASTGKVEQPKGGGPPAGEPPIVDDNGVKSSWGSSPDVAIKGVQSNPAFQWKHVVKAGESPSSIAAIYFGTGQLPKAYELVDYNKSVAGKATVGDPLNPNTTKYNFKSLVPGERILIPKTWNAWIDQQGYPRKSATPFPKPAGVVA